MGREDGIAQDLVDRSLQREAGDRCRVLSENQSLPEPIRKALNKLSEDISSGDWAKIGVLLGVLWYRIDRTIGELERIAQSTKNIERSTAQWLAAIKELRSAVVSRRS